MQNPTVRTVEYQEYSTEIKENWLEDFLDWTLTELKHWIDRNIEAGNDEFIELTDIDWDHTRTRIYENDLKKFETNAVTIVSLVDDDSVVGGVYVDQIDDSIAKINRLWLSKKYRGHGYGHKLVKRAVTIANEQGVDVVRLSTGPFMQTAQSIYRSLGFKYRGEPFPNTTVPESLTDYWNFMELEV